MQIVLQSFKMFNHHLIFGINCYHKLENCYGILCTTFQFALVCLSIKFLFEFGSHLHILRLQLYLNIISKFFILVNHIVLCCSDLRRFVQASYVQWKRAGRVVPLLVPVLIVLRKLLGVLFLCAILHIFENWPECEFIYLHNGELLDWTRLHFRKSNRDAE